MITPVKQLRFGLGIGGFNQSSQETFRWLLGPNFRNFCIVGLKIIGGGLIVLVKDARTDIDTRVFVEQRLLFVRSIFGRGLIGEFQLLTQGLVILFEFFG